VEDHHLSLARIALFGTLCLGLSVVPAASAHVQAQTYLPAPTGFTVVTPTGAEAGSSLILRWNQVAGATGYEVLVKRGGKWVLNDNDPNYTPLTNSTTISGLNSAEQYAFRVRAICDKGKGALTAVVSGQTHIADISLPSFSISSGSHEGPADSPVTTTTIGVLTVPTGLFGLFSEGDRVRLTWQPVAAAMRYVVEEQIKGKWQPANDVVGEPASTSVTLLNHGVPGPWVFRIRAMGSDGSFSDPSWPVTVERH
jgi:hypothetical protein